MIDRILIPSGFFSGSPSVKNSVVKRAWSEVISVWVID
jgi:hypothetical protein